MKKRSNLPPIKRTGNLLMVNFRKAAEEKAKQELKKKTKQKLDDVMRGLETAYKKRAATHADVFYYNENNPLVRGLYEHLKKQPSRSVSVKLEVEASLGIISLYCSMGAL